MNVQKEVRVENLLELLMEGEEEALILIKGVGGKLIFSYLLINMKLE
jgi:tRNA A22 N-methylase